MTAPGIYLHVPFCATRCPYCDFNIVEGAGAEAMQRYVAALRADLERVVRAGPRAVAPEHADVDHDWPAFGSVFIGGGTPTLLPPDALAGILCHVRDLLPINADAEVTVEANPETVEVTSLATLVEAGLTRLSIGAQSLAPHVLAFLGRTHDPERPLRALAGTRAAGVRSVNLDLIYGTPGETDGDWQATLDAVVHAQPDHVSAYALTVEPNTPYGVHVHRGQASAPDEDVQAARMATADRALTAAGYIRYEVSNWARPGHESRHNRTYWRGGNYLGVGAGAHGHWAGRRWWCLRPTDRYVRTARAGASTIAGAEILDDATRRTERLLLGLRTIEGVARGDVEPIDEAALTRLTAAGLLRATGERLQPTSSGLAVADALTRALT